MKMISLRIENINKKKKNIKKIEFQELKSTNIEMKNSLDKLKSRFELAKESAKRKNQKIGQFR